MVSKHFQEFSPKNSVGMRQNRRFSMISASAAANGASAGGLPINLKGTFSNKGTYFEE